MDFLKPKWNLDNDYAAQVLGFLAGYLPNHRDARKYYKSIRKEIKNARLVRLLDDISDGDFSSRASYLDTSGLCVLLISLKRQLTFFLIVTV
jgi:hypothetical protein